MRASRYFQGLLFGWKRASSVGISSVRLLLAGKRQGRPARADSYAQNGATAVIGSRSAAPATRSGVVL
eukprot:11195300-Lingulodinium_polyedra.AAC.1